MGVQAGLTRCSWAGSDPLYVAYHDTEWGVPQRDPLVLFEFLVLEGAQAGLSWSTILRKRDGYRAAFAGFDPLAVAAFTDDDVARCMADAGIVRNRQKVDAAIHNAAAVVALAIVVGVVATSGRRAVPAVAPRPSGWHPDPHDDRLLRFWDGTNWTSHTRPR